MTGRVRSPGCPAGRPLAVLAACCLLAAGPGGAATHRYGDITIEDQPLPNCPSWHGHAEYRFVVANSSRDKSHSVRLLMPGERYGYQQVVEVSRRAVVAPQAVVTLTLYRPAMSAGGQSVAVYVDGDRQRRVMPTDLDSHGPRSSMMHTGFTSSHSYGEQWAALLVSRQCRKWADNTDWSGRGYPVEWGRSELPVDQWGTNWLGYSRYDGIVVSADELEAAPAEVRRALFGYVRCGGLLLVLGSWTPPREWEGRELPHVQGFALGLGACLAPGRVDGANGKLARRTEDVFGTLLAQYSRSHVSAPLSPHLHRGMPVVEDIGVPVRGMFGLMAAFVVLIGPVNLYLLSRKRKRIWMLWTVPAVSLLTCGVVFGYSIVAEGFGGHYRATLVTILDENAQEATTFGYVGFYSPLTPRSGLRFSSRTEATHRGRQSEQDKYYYGPSYRSSSPDERFRSIDWSDGQHLAAGWVVSRIPAYFRIRKNEPRRERLALERRENGDLAVMNGLGARVTKLLLADRDGMVYRASDLAPGARTVLIAEGTLRAEGVEGLDPDALRDSFLSAAQALADPKPRNLRPGSYLALLDRSPFVEPALEGAEAHENLVVVYGLLKRP